MRYLKFVITIFVSSFIFSEANDFKAILKNIELNNIKLQSSKTCTDALKLEVKTTNALPPPELELGYLWGNNGIGNRIDLGLSQSFEFPTVYARRNKLIKQRIANADLSYLDNRQKILLRAKQLCIQIVSYNALNHHFKKDLEQAEGVARSIEKQFDEGEATAIEYNKAKQNVVVFLNELKHFESLKKSLLAELKYLNGGKDVVLNDTMLTHTILPKSFDLWLNYHVDRNPSYQLAQGELKEREQELRLAKSQWLPNISLGYASEKERDAHYQGLQFGISIPIWNTVRHIKAHNKQVEAARLQVQDLKREIFMSLYNIYNEALVLQETVHNFQQALNNYNNTDLLKKSLEHGQINIITYLQEIQWGHEMREKQLQAECELELKIAELTASDL